MENEDKQRAGHLIRFDGQTGNLESAVSANSIRGNLPQHNLVGNVLQPQQFNRSQPPSIYLNQFSLLNQNLMSQNPVYSNYSNASAGEFQGNHTLASPFNRGPPIFNLTSNPQSANLQANRLIYNQVYNPAYAYRQQPNYVYTGTMSGYPPGFHQPPIGPQFLYPPGLHPPTIHPTFQRNPQMSLNDAFQSKFYQEQIANQRMPEQQAFFQHLLRAHDREMYRLKLIEHHFRKQLMDHVISEQIGSLQSAEGRSNSLPAWNGVVQNAANPNSFNALVSGQMSDNRHQLAIDQRHYSDLNCVASPSNRLNNPSNFGGNAQFESVSSVADPSRLGLSTSSDDVSLRLIDSVKSVTSLSSNSSNDQSTATDLLADQPADQPADEHPSNKRSADEQFVRISNPKTHNCSVNDPPGEHLNKITANDRRSPFERQLLICKSSGHQVPVHSVPSTSHRSSEPFSGLNLAGPLALSSSPSIESHDPNNNCQRPTETKKSTPPSTTIKSRPKKFDLVYLKIGKFELNSTYKSDEQRKVILETYAAKLKIVFSEQRIVYEFSQPVERRGLQDAGESIEQRPNPDRQATAPEIAWTFHTIVVPFHTIDAVSVQKDEARLVVNSRPILQPGAYDDVSSPFERQVNRDPTFGESSSNALHLLRFATLQARRFKASLMNFTSEAPTKQRDEAKNPSACVNLFREKFLVYIKPPEKYMKKLPKTKLEDRSCGAEEKVAHRSLNDSTKSSGLPSADQASSGNVLEAISNVVQAPLPGDPTEAIGLRQDHERKKRKETDLPPDQESKRLCGADSVILKANPTIDQCSANIDDASTISLLSPSSVLRIELSDLSSESSNESLFETLWMHPPIVGEGSLADSPSDSIEKIDERPKFGGCACRARCVSNGCSCFKDGRVCSADTCDCAECGNPWFPFCLLNIDVSKLKQDHCLMRNLQLMSYDELSKLLNSRFYLPCCKTPVNLSSTIPGTFFCNQQKCQKPLRYSWCNRKFVSLQASQHCEVGIANSEWILCITLEPIHQSISL